MSQLDEYPLYDLATVTGGTLAHVKPGDFVSYSNEPWTTLGILIARVNVSSAWGERVLVLWSSAPKARVSTDRRGRWDDL